MPWHAWFWNYAWSSSPGKCGLYDALRIFFFCSIQANMDLASGSSNHAAAWRNRTEKQTLQVDWQKNTFNVTGSTRFISKFQPLNKGSQGHKVSNIVNTYPFQHRDGVIRMPNSWHHFTSWKPSPCLQHIICASFHTSGISICDIYSRKNNENLYKDHISSISWCKNHIFSICSYFFCRWSSHFHSFPIHRHRLDLRPPWSPAPWDRSCRSLRAAPAAGRRRCGLHPTPTPTGDLSKGPKGTWQRGTKGEPKKTKWNN